MSGRELFSLEQGIAETADYMGYFLIRKGLVTFKGLQEYAAGMKRFFRCMAKYGYITEESAEDRCELIKENLPDCMGEAETF